MSPARVRCGNIFGFARGLANKVLLRTTQSYRGYIRFVDSSRARFTAEGVRIVGISTGHDRVMLSFDLGVLAVQYAIVGLAFEILHHSAKYLRALCSSFLYLFGKFVEAELDAWPRAVVQASEVAENGSELFHCRRL